MSTRGFPAEGATEGVAGPEPRRQVLSGEVIPPHPASNETTQPGITRPETPTLVSEVIELQTPQRPPVRRPARVSYGLLGGLALVAALAAAGLLASGLVGSASTGTTTAAPAATAAAAEKPRIVSSPVQVVFEPPAPTAAPAPAAPVAPAQVAPAAPRALSPADRLAAARAQLGAGNWRQALADLEQLNAADPTLPGLAETLGAARLEAARDAMRRGDFAAAADAFDSVLAVRPGDPDAQAGRRDAILGGRYAAAEAAWGHDDARVLAELEAIYAENPAYRDVADKLYAALIARANAQIAAGDLGGARETVERALAVAPDRPEARDLLALLTSPDAADQGADQSAASQGGRLSIGDLQRALQERQEQRKRR
ncbi:MAG: hypothetical protein IT307_03390 [Chloroflexi bacterium]|nr:hypothetical protein [Chloroflexota bacterium]